MARKTPTRVSRAEAISQLWVRGNLSFKCHAAQLIIYELIKSLPKDQREALLFCARRFGKSYLGCILALEDAIQNPDIQVAIIGPTLTQTRKIVRPILRKICKDAPDGLVTESKSTSTWKISNGSTIVISGFDTVLESMRGQEFFSAYGEETGLAPADLEEYEYLLYSVIFPTMMHSRGRFHHLTTPSRIVDHPLHLETLPKCQKNNAFYLFTIDQNPMLSAETIAGEVELLNGRGTVACERELYCKIVRDESITVVPQFDEAVHVSTSPLELKTSYKYLVAGDMGYLDDLSVFLLLAYDHDLGKICVLREKVFSPLTASQEIADSLREWDCYKPAKIADIQGNTRIDMSCMDAAFGPPIKDLFQSTITYIRNQFFQNQFLVDPSCSLLIQTCRSLTFNKAKTDFRRTTTLGHGDSLMALIYGSRSVDKVTDLRPKPRKENVFSLPVDPPHVASLKGLTYSGSR